MDNYYAQFDLLRSRAFLETDNSELFWQLLFYMEFYRDYGAHITLYCDILDAQPYAAMAWYNLGIAYRRSDNIDEALEALEYAFICKPRFEAAYHAFADLALQDGQYRRALLSLLEMKQYVNVNEMMLVHLSECSLCCGDMKAAGRYAREALGLNPSSAEACYWLSRSNTAAGNHHAALRWLREAIRLDDSREDLHRALGEAYLQLGMYREARVHFLRAVDLAPDEAANWSGAAATLLYEDAPAQALELLDEATEFTCSFEIQYCRAACLFLLARRQEAWLVFQHALQENFGFHPAIFRWAPSLEHDPEVRNAIANFH